MIDTSIAASIATRTVAASWQLSALPPPPSSAREEEQIDKLDAAIGGVEQRAEVNVESLVEH